MTLCQRGPDPAARASMLVLARTAVHATRHGGGIFVSILHLLPYLQAVLTPPSGVSRCCATPGVARMLPLAAAPRFVRIPLMQARSCAGGSALPQTPPPVYEDSTACIEWGNRVIRGREPSTSISVSTVRTRPLASRTAVRTRPLASRTAVRIDQD